MPVMRGPGDEEVSNNLWVIPEKASSTQKRGFRNR